MNDLVVNNVVLLDAVEVLDVVHQTVFEHVRNGEGVAFVVDLVFIDQGDAQTLVEEGHLLEACAQSLVVELHGFKDVGIWPERNGGSGFSGGSALCKGSFGNTNVEALCVGEALALDFNLEVG